MGGPAGILRLYRTKFRRIQAVANTDVAMRHMKDSGSWLNRHSYYCLIALTQLLM